MLAEPAARWARRHTQTSTIGSEIVIVGGFFAEIAAVRALKRAPPLSRACEGTPGRLPRFVPPDRGSRMARCHVSTP
jgi:hypothetical protein